MNMQTSEMQGHDRKSRRKGMAFHGKDLKIQTKTPNLKMHSQKRNMIRKHRYQLEGKNVCDLSHIFKDEVGELARIFEARIRIFFSKRSGQPCAWCSGTVASPFQQRHLSVHT